MVEGLVSVDILGIERGKCKVLDCDCPKFLRISVKCEYCEHPPAQHLRSVTDQIKDSSSGQTFCNTPSRSQISNSSISQKDVSITENPTNISERCQMEPLSSESANIVISKSYTMLLPNFSEFVRPILQGTVSQGEARKMYSHLVKEIICHLDANDLCRSQNPMVTRWSYNKLGEELFKKYPQFVWPTDEIQKRKKRNNRNENAAVTKSWNKKPWSYLIHSVSNTRKQQRFRKLHYCKKSVRPKNSGTLSACSEDALEELQLHFDDDQLEVDASPFSIDSPQEDESVCEQSTSASILLNEILSAASSESRDQEMECDESEYVLPHGAGFKQETVETEQLAVASRVKELMDENLRLRQENAALSVEVRTHKNTLNSMKMDKYSARPRSRNKLLGLIIG